MEQWKLMRRTAHQNRISKYQKEKSNNWTINMHCLCSIKKRMTNGDVVIKSYNHKVCSIYVCVKVEEG